MWSRVLGLSSEKQEDSSSASKKRKDDTQTQRKRTESTVTSTLARKPSQSDERGRGFNPTSTSYSSTSRSPYPGAASASVASSYATAPSNSVNATIAPPDLVRNPSLANQMPKGKTGRDERDRGGERDGKSGRRRDRSSSRDRKVERQDRSRSRDREERKKDRREKRERKRDSERGTERGLEKIESEYKGTTRVGDVLVGSGSFNNQIGAATFTQFPGQYDGGMIGPSNGPPHPPVISNHVPDQFPGQFPSGATAPYRPPLSVNQGGPGLAADYYGDAGESVAQQPGVRPQAPSLIVGAQPHLMAASPTEAPPVEPSATGGVGAAASFFSGASFQSPSATPMPGQQSVRPAGPPLQSSSSGPPGSFAVPAALAGSPAIGYITSTHGNTSSAQRPPSSTFPPSGGVPAPYALPPTLPTGAVPSGNNYHSASAPIIPTLGSAAAAGYMIGGHASQQHQPSLPPSNGGISGYRPPTSQQSFSQNEISHHEYSGSTRPPKLGKSFPPSNVPLYAAGAVGAAGLAAAAYHHNHQSQSQNQSQGQIQSQHQASYMGRPHASTTLVHQHRHHGPLDKVVDFFRDPEGVARFEEYTEYIGLCRYCFEPGSSPRDAPRKHHYRKRRSNERLGASIRVDKESRYGVPDGESRRKKNDSWLATGIAGYGLAKVGKALFAADSDDDHSARIGHANYSTTSLHGRRYSNSPSRRTSTLYGITRKSSDAKLSHRSRSRSRDRKSGLAEASFGAAIGASVVATSSQSKPKERRSQHSPKEETGMFGSFFSSPPMPERRRSSHKKSKKKKSNGFFNFGNSSSSSSDSGVVAGTGSDRPRRKKSSNSRIKNHNDANAALIGLGAAAAALAAAEGREGDKSKRRADVVAVKEVRYKDNRKQDGEKQKRNHSAPAQEETMWVDASEEESYSSVDSMLAYGLSRRGSQESLSSNSSGTNKWSWRWGSRPEKKKKDSARKGSQFERGLGTAAGLAGVAAGAAILSQKDRRDPAIGSTGSLPPLQHVFPMSTSDPSHYDVTRHDSVTSANQPYQTPRPAAIPLQQPQPVAPISSVIYTSQAPYDHAYSAPAGPPILSQQPHPFSYATGYVFRPQTDAQTATPRDVAPVQELRRRDTSPTPEVVHIEPRTPKRASTDLSSAQFDVVGKQEDKKRKEERHERTKSASSGRGKDRRDTREEVGAIDRQPKSKRKSSDEREEKGRREDEIDKELEQLRKEEAEASKKKKRDSWVAPALAGVAGAVVGAATAGEVSKSDDRRERRREEKEAQRAAEIRNQQFEEAEQRKSDEKQAAIAKKAAALIKRTPSPSTHKSYVDFFVPAELQSKSKGTAPKDDSNGGNDITTFSAPDIITVEPTERGYPSADAYTFEGGEIDPNHMKLPGQVPRLILIEPTPPTSMAGSVRGDASPIMRPEDIHSSDDEKSAKQTTKEPTKEPAKEPAKVKVTFGESETREYEVITPEYHRDEFIDSSHDSRKNRTDVAEKPNVVETKPTVIESPVEEIKRDRIPGQFEDDIDFAATLAAGVEASGFDPAIVIDNPTYHSRESPPGSDNTGFYRTPYFETVTDLGLDPPVRGFVVGELPPTPKEEVGAAIKDEVKPAAEYAVTPTPKYEVTPTANDEVKSYVARPLTDDEAVRTGRRSEKKKEAQKTQAKDPFFVPLSSMSRNPPKIPEAPESSHPYSQEPEVIEATPRSIPSKADDFSVEIGKGSADTKPTSQPRAKPDEFYDASESPREMSKEPKRGIIQKLATDIPLPGNDDDEWTPTPRSEIKSEGRRSNGDEDEYDSAGDVASTAMTAPLPDDGDEPRKHRKKSKRKSSGYYDDTASFVSAPAKYDDSREAIGKGKKEKKGGLFGLFSKSTEPAPEKEATRDDFEEPKRKGGKNSKDRMSKRDSGDFYSQASESVADLSRATEEGTNGHSRKSSKGKNERSSRDKDDRLSRDKDERRKSRKSSKTDGDPGRATQELPAKVYMPDRPGRAFSIDSLKMLIYPQNLNTPDEELDLISEYENDPGEGTSRSREQEEPLSFLGVRREETEPPDLAGLPDPGGSDSRRMSVETAFRDSLSSKIVEGSLPPLPPSRPTTPTAVGSLRDLPPLPGSMPASPAVTPAGQRRRVSILQLSESGHAMASSSPTAIPLMFRRFPTSTGVSRSSPSTPGQSPQGLTKLSPRNRQSRPLSTEFKSSKEFRPLWLVERHATDPSRRKETPEEVYPSLPSSHSNSRASSVHQDDENELLERWAMDEDVTLSHEPPPFDERELEYRPDLLDSQQPTPTKDSFQIEQANEGARTLQDPSFPGEAPFTQPFDFEGPWFKYGWEDPRELPSLPKSRASSTYDEQSDNSTSSTVVGAAAGALAAAAAITTVSVLHHDREKEQQAPATSPPEPDVAAEWERSGQMFEADTVEPSTEIAPLTDVKDNKQEEKIARMDDGDTLRDAPTRSLRPAALGLAPLVEDKNNILDELRPAEEERKDGSDLSRSEATVLPIPTGPEPTPLAEDKEDTVMDEPGPVEEEPVQATPDEWSSSVSKKSKKNKKGKGKNRGLEPTETPETPQGETPGVADIPGGFPEEPEPTAAPEDYFQNPASSKKGKKGKGKNRGLETTEPLETPQEETPGVADIPGGFPESEPVATGEDYFQSLASSKKGKKGKRKNRGLETTEPLETPQEETPGVVDIPGGFPEESEPAATTEDYFQNSASSKKGKKGKKGKGTSLSTETPEAPSTPSAFQDEDTSQTAVEDWPTSSKSKKGKKGQTGKPASLEVEALSTPESSREVADEPVSAVEDWVASSSSKKGKKGKNGKEKGQSSEVPETPDLPGGFPDEIVVQPQGVDETASKDIEQGAAEAHDEPYDKGSEQVNSRLLSEGPSDRTLFGTTVAIAAAAGAAVTGLTSKKDKKRKGKKKGVAFEEESTSEPTETQAALEAKEEQDDLLAETTPTNENPAERSISEPYYTQDLIAPDEEQEPPTSFSAPDASSVKHVTKEQEIQPQPPQSQQHGIVEATPANIQLPLDDDLDLLPALPNSPVLEGQTTCEVDEALPSKHYAPSLLPEHLAETDFKTQPAKETTLEEEQPAMSEIDVVPKTAKEEFAVEDPSTVLSQAQHTPSTLQEHFTETNAPSQSAKEITAEAQPADIELEDVPKISIETESVSEDAPPSEHNIRSISQEPLAESDIHSQIAEETTLSEAQPAAIELVDTPDTFGEEESIVAKEPGAVLSDPSVQGTEGEDTNSPKSREVDDDVPVYTMKRGKNGKKNRKSQSVTPLIESLPEELEATQQLTEALETAQVPTNVTVKDFAFKEPPPSNKEGKRGKKKKLVFDDWPTEGPQPNSSEASRDLPAERVEKQIQDMQQSESITTRDDGSSFSVTEEKTAVEGSPIPQSSSTFEPTPASDGTAKEVGSMLAHPDNGPIEDPLVAEEAIIPVAEPFQPTGDAVEEPKGLYSLPKSKKDKKKRKNLSRSDSSYLNAVATMEPPLKTVRILEALPEKLWPQSADEVLLGEASNAALPESDDNDLLVDKTKDVEPSGDRGLELPQTQTLMAALPTEGSEILADYHKPTASPLPITVALSSEARILDEASGKSLPADIDSDLVEENQSIAKSTPDPVDQHDAIPSMKVTENVVPYEQPPPDILEEAVHAPPPQDDRDDYFGPRESDLSSYKQPLSEILDEAVHAPLPTDDRDHYSEPQEVERELAPGPGLVRDDAPSLPEVSWQALEVIQPVESSVESLHERSTPSLGQVDPLQQQSYLPQIDAIFDDTMQKPLPDDEQDGYFQTTRNSPEPEEEFISAFNPTGESAVPLSEDKPEDLQVVDTPRSAPHAEHTAVIESAHAKLLSEEPVAPAEDADINRDLEETAGFETPSSKKKGGKDKKKGKSRAPDWTEEAHAESSQEQSVSEPADDAGIGAKTLSVLGSLVAGSAVAGLLGSKKSKKGKKKSKSKATNWEEEQPAQDFQAESDPESSRTVENFVDKPTPIAPVPDDTDLLTSKKNKKDKKKRASAADWDEEPSILEAETIPKSESARPIDESSAKPDSTLTIEEAAPVVDDADFLPSRKSKKDKKKSKKGQAYDWTDTSTGTTTPALPETLPETLPEILPVASGADDVRDPDTDTLATKAVEIEPEPETLETFSLKKSKIDKKKAKKSASMTGDEQPEQTPTLETIESTEKDRAMFVPEEDLPEVPFEQPTEEAVPGEVQPDLPTPIPLDDPEPEGTEYFSLIKSKKDKKKTKKDKSMARDEETEAATTLQEIALTDKDRAIIVTDEELAEVPFEQPSVGGTLPDVSTETSTYLHEEPMSQEALLEPAPNTDESYHPQAESIEHLEQAQESEVARSVEPPQVVQDEIFVPFGTKKRKKGKKSKLSPPSGRESQGASTPLIEEETPVTTTQDRAVSAPGFEHPPTIPDSVREEEQPNFHHDDQPETVTETIAAGTTHDVTQDVPSIAQELATEVSGFGHEQETADNDGFGSFTIKKKKGKKGKKAQNANSTSITPDVEAEPIVAGDVESTKDFKELSEAAKASPVHEEQDTPATQDDFLDFGTIKRKKSKKSKKQAPVIWEDETATPALMEIPTYADEAIAGPSLQPLETLYEGEPFTPQEPSYQAPVSEPDPEFRPAIDRQSSDDITNRALEQGEYPIPPLEDILRDEDAADKQEHDPAAYEEIRKQAFERELDAATRDETTAEDMLLSPDSAQHQSLRVVTDQLSVEQAEESLGISRRRSWTGKHRKGDHSPAGRHSSASSSSRSLGLLPGDIEHSPHSPSSPRSLGLLPGDVERMSSRHMAAHVHEPGPAEEASLYQDREAPIGDDHSQAPSHFVEQPSERKTVSGQYHKEIREPPRGSTSIQSQELDPSRDLEPDIPVNVTEAKKLKNTARAAAIVPSVGAGVALFENLARKDSVAEKDKGKKRIGVRRSDWEESKRGETSSEQAGESHDTVRALSSAQDQPAVEVHKTRDGHEPSLVSRDEHRPSARSPRVSTLQEDSDLNRDSAVHISNSPLPGDLARFQHSLRDSGYQGTEASPTFRDSLGNTGSHRDFRTSGESFANIRDPQGTSLRDSGTTFDSSTSMADSFENPLNISIEVDPAYNVSISRPEAHGPQTVISEVRDRDSGEQLPVLYQEYLVRDSVSPVRSHAESQPSPVDSSTKPRSSELFQSSPSTREDLTRSLPKQQNSPSYSVPGHQGYSASMDDFTTPTKQPTHQERPRSGDTETIQGPTTSLFGGPVGINSDIQSLISPPGTPLSPSRHQLNTINEHSPEHTSLQKRISGSSDMSLSEPGLRAQRRSGTPQNVSQKRVRSPLAAASEGKDRVSIDDLDSRLSWPAVDEDTHSVDLERSKSRNTSVGRRSSSRHSQSPLPPLATDLIRQHEADYRSVSGASIRSNDSITAIIRDQDIKSPSTPPLRRVDRSVSSDLRAANKRSEAKKLAKSAEPDLSIEPVTASSSTYDPLNDKGKARITKMADVYVSCSVVQYI